jgi:hypothetical protein
MAYEVVRGFTDYDSSLNPKHLRIDQIAFSHNMEWISSKEIYTRRGSTLSRDDTNWPGAYVIDGTTFKKRSDSFYYEIHFLNDGRMFYVKSNNASFTSTSVAMTEIVASDGSSSPALAVNNKVSYDGINNTLVIADGSSNLWSWTGDDNQLHLIADPTIFTLTYTVGSSTATIGDTYTDNADASRVYEVKASITTATTITLRQIAGETRTAQTGTLNRLTGAGSATMTFTAWTASDTWEEIKLYKRRANAISNEGNVVTSISRVPTNFTGAGSGNLEIDVIEGLSVSNFIPFKRGAVITTEDRVTEKFNISTLTGFKFFDAAVPGSEVGQFKVERESKLHGFVGRSGQELGNVMIGLTRNGFIGFGGQVSNEFGLTDQGSLSDPIKDQINDINFAAADQIFSVVDTINQRYYCVCPVFDSTEADTIFAYDYAKSKDGFNRWSVWSMAFGNIRGMFVLKNNVYMSDSDGNVYQILVDSVYTDNALGYTSRFESAAIGANSSMVDKTLKNVWIDFLIPTVEQEVTVYSKLDGHIIFKQPTGTQIQKAKLTPRKSINDVISDFTFIDNRTLIGAGTLSDFQYHHARIGGKGAVEQIGVTSSEAGINWGVSGFMLELDARGGSRGQ